MTARSLKTAVDWAASTCRWRGPSFRAEIAFFYDPFVRFASTLDAIFQLAVSLGELRYHFICPARGVTIEGSGMQKYASSELESVRGHLCRKRRLNHGAHATTSCQTRPVEFTFRPD